jgi:Glycosyl Hydrolase Family 88
VLLRNWTRIDPTDMRFSTAAEGQLQYLLNVAPRSASGAISHREDQVELWFVFSVDSFYPESQAEPLTCCPALVKIRSDFVYMAPPFIAYFGALQNDSRGNVLLQTAYDQVRLYRDALFDANASLWRHIAMGSMVDTGHWATGTQDICCHEPTEKGALAKATET